MKKLLLLVAVCCVAVIVAWKLFSGNDAKTPEEPKDQPLVISSNSPVFDRSFSKLLGDYYAISDALVEWDSAKADIIAKQLGLKADSLPFGELKGDSSIILTAQNLATSISSEIKGFISETSLEQKRRAFNMLTDEMYNIIRTVRYSGQKVYYIKCEKAFKESGEAYWLSSTNKIANPYLGKNHPTYKDAMIGNGDIIDSLDFVKK
jgi:hypothetical protein